MGKPLYEWIKASLDKSFMPKNGYVVVSDFKYKAQAYRHFRDAHIEEVTTRVEESMPDDRLGDARLCLGDLLRERGRREARMLPRTDLVRGSQDGRRGTTAIAKLPDQRF